MGSGSKPPRCPDAALTPGEAVLTSVSCAAPGACTAGGWYYDTSFHYQAFAVEERHGQWGNALELPGSATLGNGYETAVRAISCGAPGECVAGGQYMGRAGRRRAFVSVETHGHWDDAIRVRGSNSTKALPLPWR